MVIIAAVQIVQVWQMVMPRWLNTGSITMAMDLVLHQKLILHFGRAFWSIAF